MDIIVRWDGLDAQETSCELNTIKGAAWLASFSCSGAGLTWLEDDEIRVGKDGWTLELDQEPTSRRRSYSLLRGQQMLTCSTMLSPSGVQVSTRKVK